MEQFFAAIIDKIWNEYNRREREKIKKDLESKMSKDFQDLKNKMEALLKFFKELEGSTQSDVQLLREEVEKIQGKKEKERARVLESRLRKNVRQLSRRIQTLEEDVEDWPKTIKYELQVRRAELEKIQGMNVENIALALETMLRKNKRQLSQKIQTLEDDINECLDTMKYELQVLKEELEEKIQGLKPGPKPESKLQPMAVTTSTRSKKCTAKTDRPVEDDDDDDAGEGPSTPPEMKPGVKATGTRSETNIKSFSLKDLCGLRKSYTW